MTALVAVSLGMHSLGVCPQSNSSSNWLWKTAKGHSYSCASSAGGTNDLGTAPQMCENDPTSVLTKITPGKAECLEASLASCKIPMHDFTSLDYDFSISGCLGIWAAPLWMTPDTWQWGPGSGEVDSMEFCSRDSIHLNFAGGGHQLKIDLSISEAEGHVTVRKDAAGIVTITSCSAAEVKNSQCPSPTYTSCSDCLKADRFAWLVTNVIWIVV